MIQSEGRNLRLLRPLLKTALLLMKNVIKLLAKRVLVPLELTGAASAADAGINNKILGSCNTTLRTSNDKTEDIIKIVKSLENSGFF